MRVEAGLLTNVLLELLGLQASRSPDRLVSRCPMKCRLHPEAETGGVSAVW